MTPNDGPFIEVEEPGTCLVCGETCTTVEVNFEVYLHPGGHCEKCLDEHYWEAVGQGVGDEDA